MTTAAEETSQTSSPACELCSQTESLTEFELVRFLEYVKQSGTQAKQLFELPGLANSGCRQEVENEMQYLAEISSQLVGEVRAARRGRNETDLSAFGYWPISDWQQHLDADADYLHSVVSFGPLRQFMRAIAQQKTNSPSYSRACRDSAIHHFEVGHCCGEIGKAGITVSWVE